MQCVWLCVYMYMRALLEGLVYVLCCVACLSFFLHTYSVLRLKTIYFHNIKIRAALLWSIVYLSRLKSSILPCWPVADQILRKKWNTKETNSDNSVLTALEVGTSYVLCIRYSRLSMFRTRIIRILRISKRLSESITHFDCFLQQ